MIKQPTLFIIGAGASAELGFPTGSGLLDDIRKITQPSGLDPDPSPDQDMDREIINFQKLVIRAAAEHEMDAQQMIDAAVRLNQKIDGPVKSIDQLIHNHQLDSQFVLVAKLAIAHIIAQKEAQVLERANGQSWQITPWPKNNWLERFATHYFAGYQKNDLSNLFNDIAFVCFNYDRCIKFGLAHLAAYQFHLSDDQALNLVERITVLHPYGNLGEMPKNWAELNYWTSNSSQHNEVIKMAANIRTFTESKEQSTTSAILEEVSKCQKVVSLGFAYQPMNVELFTGNYKSLYGTTLGMSNHNAQVATELLFSSLNKSTPYVAKIYRADVTASKFLDDYEHALFR